MRDVAKLKIEALYIAETIKRASFFKRIKLRSKLRQMLDEIEYQEGRKQYANRPYSKPTACHPEGCTLNCRCGCWKAKRAQYIGI